MPSLARNNEFRDSLPHIAPSLLLCDFGRLAEEVQAVEAAGAKCLHLDVMDGIFVPNITYGMPIVRAVRAASQLPIDVHLMIANPARYIDEFVEAGADSLTIHVEAVDDPLPILKQIRSCGVSAGLAINPSTPLQSAEAALGECDLILAMSVEPGFGAQKFDPVALEKLQELRRRVPSETLLEIDGGVNVDTVARCAAAGAQLLVVGSAIFRRKDASYAESLLELTQLAHAAV
ncbi:MAG: ribulose-phosphate 3-epimerase [Planctomycetales bacterium]|nr:ribulose-phosphate 3-epimerase [Planctomycetales bacterium]